MRFPSARTIVGPLVGLVLTVGLSAQVEAAESTPGSFAVAQMADDDPNAPAPVDDPGSAAALTVRIDRLESTVRSLTGQIEQLQFQNRKLTDDLRKMQEDVDFRFQDLGKAGPAGGQRPIPAKRSSADQPAGDGLPQDASGVDPAAPARDVAQAPRRTGDAFDPDANPSAPGAPRPLGATTPSPPLTSRRDASTASAAPNAPLDLMRRSTTPQDQSTENGVAPILPDAAGQTDVAPRATPNPNAVASLAPGGTRDEFSADLDLYRQGQYDGAATGLKTFIDKYPRDRMVPDAVYLLGETYTKLGRHREAAEQYLRLSTDFSKAPRAPDALLRLGIALNAMGVREQACATYQEVTRRYPAASSDVRAGVDRELKRARC